MAEEFDINGSFEVRRMSSGSFALITLYFLIALILFMIFQFAGNSSIVLFCCLFFAPSNFTFNVADSPGMLYVIG